MTHGSKYNGSHPPARLTRKSTAVRATLYPVHCSISDIRHAELRIDRGIGPLSLHKNRTITRNANCVSLGSTASFWRLSMAPVIIMTYL